MDVKSLLKVLILLVPTASFASKIQFTSDGNFLGQVSKEGDSINIWNLNKKTVQANISSTSGKIRDYVFYPDNKRILSIFSNNTAKVLDWTTGKELMTFPSSHTTLSDDGKKIAALMLDKKTIKILDSISFEEIQQITVENVSSFALSQDASILAIANYEKPVTVLSLANQKVVREFRVSTPVYKLQFSSNAQNLMIISEGRNIDCNIWNMTTGENVLNLMDEYLDVASFTRDGQHVIGFGPYISTYVWDLKSKNQLHLLEYSLSTSKISLPQVTSMDGKLVSHIGRTLNISNLHGDLLSSVTAEGSITEAVINANGNIAAIETSEKLTFWNITH